MQQSLPEMKRDAETVLGSTVVDMMYSETSSLKANSLLRQLEMIPYLANAIEKSPTEVIAKLSTLRDHCEYSAILAFSFSDSTSTETFGDPICGDW